MTARLLSEKTLAQLPADIHLPAYDRSNRSRGVVHIGPGAFHRAHQAVYTDLAMAHGGNWLISGVSMRSATLKEKLAEQDGLYSLVVLDNVPYIRVIGALTDVLALNEDRHDVMAALTDASTHIISLTITEKGYCLNSQGELDTDHRDILHDLKSPEQPVSAIGLLALALHKRCQSGAAEVTVVSCDNLAENGKKLEKAVVTFAQMAFPKTAGWIADEICFPSTMVDSITPATDESLIKQTFERLGVEDRWPIQREGFSQWVVEDKFSGPRPAWEKVGVTFTDDVGIFENAKLRILNGTHSTLAYLGILLGKETVYEAISDDAIEHFIRRMLSEEIVPSIQTSGKMDLASYSDAIIARYHNRHIRHLLSQIAWDGSQKLPFRILNTIRSNIVSGRPFRLLCVPLAAWILFIAKRIRDNESIVDPMTDTLLQLATQCSGDIVGLANEILNLEDVFAELSQDHSFKDTVIQHVKTLSLLNADNAAEVLRKLECTV